MIDDGTDGNRSQLGITLGMGTDMYKFHPMEKSCLQTTSAGSHGFGNNGDFLKAAPVSRLNSKSKNTENAGLRYVSKLGSDSLIFSNWYCTPIV